MRDGTAGPFSLGGVTRTTGRWHQPQNGWGSGKDNNVVLRRESARAGATRIGGTGERGGAQQSLRATMARHCWLVKRQCYPTRCVGHDENTTPLDLCLRLLGRRFVGSRFVCTDCLTYPLSPRMTILRSTFFLCELMLDDEVLQPIRRTAEGWPGRRERKNFWCPLLRNFGTGEKENLICWRKSELYCCMGVYVECVDGAVASTAPVFCSQHHCFVL